MILRIIKYGHPTLRLKGSEIRKIDDKLRTLASDMIQTMESANGVGLAAQQVGMPIQLAVVDVAGIEDRPSTMSVKGEPVNVEEYMPLVLVNPELELSGEKEMGLEGCLSFPEITGDIARAPHVTARAQTLDGDEIEFEATGLLARALQHEVDHLHGVLFIDRMTSATKTALASKLKRLQKETRG
ncbi:MAG: peptide deformylase [Chthoniobacteraceae bacterium]